MNFITETQTFNELDQSLSSQVDNLPPSLFLWLLYILIIFGILYLGVRIWKVHKAPGSDLIKEYKENLEKTMDDSMQKSQILTLIDQVSKEIPYLLELNRTNQKSQLTAHGRKVMDMIIEQIPLTLKSMKKINHRCAIFVVDDEDPSQLKIFEGCGFSVKGKEKLRLKISSSIAGKTLSKGEYTYCKDVTEDKNFQKKPEATKTYYSLLCCPIMLNSSPIAVLSIDGSVKDCFSEDDIAYFQLFSNQLAIIFDVVGKDNIEGGVWYEQEIQDAR